MRIELGQHVQTRDGHDIGKIVKFVVDPRDGTVNQAIIHHGFIVTRDVEIPIEAMESDGNGGIRLRMTSDEVRQRPRFVDGAFRSPTPSPRPLDDLPAAAAVIPVQYIFFGGGAPDPILVDDALATRRPHDPMSAVIDAGDQVRDRYGEKVGEVHSVIVDSGTEHVTAIVVRTGFPFSHGLELPASAIDGANDEAIFLKIEKDEVEKVGRRVKP